EIDQSFLDYKDTLTTASIHLEAMRDNYIQDQVIQTRGKIEWNRGSFLKLDTSLQQEVLFELTKKSRLSKAMIDELRHVIAMDKPNHTMAIKGVCFTKEYDVLSLQKLVKKPNMTSIVLQEMKDYPISEDWMISIHKKRCNCECNSSNIWYNSTMLPLVARCRRDGDEIEFDYGTKKVKRCFIDQKVGQSKRKQPILLEKNGRILAILGVASSKHLPALEDCDIVIELKETKNESESLH
ncbi:MAG: tRNA lysidine(34) synthetase TilS, partial [Bacilli bacterium]